MASMTDTREGITLACTPSKEGETVVFAYTLENGNARAVYVSDAGTRIDPAARTASPDPDAVTIWLGRDRYANVLKGVAELPPERDIPGVVMPLMHRLGPGERIERRLVLQLPLAEHSPYYAVGSVRDYRLADIEGVRLGIDVLPTPPVASDGTPFAAAPVAFAPGYVDIGVRGTLPLLRRVACSFRAKGLHLMVRTDDYPRPD